MRLKREESVFLRVCLICASGVFFSSDPSMACGAGAADLH